MTTNFIAYILKPRAVVPTEAGEGHAPPVFPRKVKFFEVTCCFEPTQFFRACYGPVTHPLPNNNSR